METEEVQIDDHKKSEEFHNIPRGHFSDTNVN